MVGQAAVLEQHAVVGVRTEGGKEAIGGKGGGLE